MSPARDRACDITVCLRGRELDVEDSWTVKGVMRGGAGPFFSFDHHRLFMDHTFGSYNRKYLFGKAHVDELGIGQSLNHRGSKAAEQSIQEFDAQQMC